MSIAKKLQAALESYTGRKVKSIKTSPDPKVAGTHAARAVMEKGDTIDFFVIGNQLEKGSIARASVDEVAEAIEECQFSEWPPKPGPLRFF